MRHVGRVHEGIVVEEAEEDTPPVGVFWGDHRPPHADVPTRWPKVRGPALPNFKQEICAIR